VLLHEPFLCLLTFHPRALLLLLLLLLTDQKKTQDSMNSRLKLVMKSGKAILGYKASVKSLRKTKAKMILISSNCPHLRKSEVEYLAMLAKTPVHHYAGDNTALGTACGKFFNVSVMSVLDGGDSDILTSSA
jgi:large subunit ribosomal protein L30e